jgi:hypothetical protein
MNDYMVFFELYGKKMKIHIRADDEEEAKATIREAVIFHKIVDDPPYAPPEGDPFPPLDNNNDMFDYLMNLFGKPKP